MRFFEPRLWLLLAVFFAGCGQNPKQDAPAHRPPHGFSQIEIECPENLKAQAYNIDTLLCARANADCFNGVCLLAKNGKPFYRKAFGYRNFETKDSLQTDDCFQLASVSKTLTAYGALLLLQAGKIKLTDSLQQYFPSFPYHGISVELLLQHRSGLANYMYCCDSFWSDHEKPMHNADVLNMFCTQKPAAYSTPGLQFDYCNSNYVLLASIIEKASGLSFSAYMKRFVFEPLGMTSTFYASDSTHPAFSSRVPGHNHRHEIAEQTYLDGCLGDKGLYSNVNDLLRFDIALQSGSLLGKEWIQKSVHPYSPEKKMSNYGYGWRLMKFDDTHWLPYHNGWWMGYKNYFIRNTYNGVTIIILTNCTKGGFLNDRQLLLLTS